jgi:radical SAM superfamily enzyme YgiQ (UPF0313 family)
MYLRGHDKILLALMPFWDPQIPPLALACIKSFLQQHHYYNVKAVDANLEMTFRELHDRYFGILNRFVPEKHKGNLFNIGNQVFRNHLMAHQHRRDEKSYKELVKILVYNTFYYSFNDQQVGELDGVVEEFYSRLERYIRELLARENPAVLGLSVYGDTLPASIFAFKQARLKSPSVKTVMGGGIFADQLAPGSSDLDYFARQTREYIDKIIIGEGELLFLKLLRNELPETQRIYTINDLGTETLNISDLAIPDFSNFDLRHYPHLAHFGARSCPYQCKFCSETINWGKYRKKDLKQIVDECEELYHRHAYQLFLMTDSTLNPIISGLAKAFIEANVSVYWDGFLRADPHVCDPDNTLLWRRGGFYRAKMGLESGSQKLLNLMNKKTTIEQYKLSLSSLAMAGIKTTTFWLFGFPGETEEDFRMTLDFLAECQDNIYEADCNVFNYYLNGQAYSPEWKKSGKSSLLYPGWARELLLSQTWVMDGEPSKETAYRRLNRFVENCKRLGIPNPYSLGEIYEADERWKKLHKNAVPSVVELKKKGSYFQECGEVRNFMTAQKRDLAGEGFDF